MQNPMASFANLFEDDSVPQTGWTRSFVDDDAYGAYNSQRFDSFYGGSDILESQPPIYGAGSEFASEDDRKGFDGDLGGSDRPILSPPSEMGAEEGVALREWRRLNAMRLEEKEKIEKDLLRQIVEEADEYKVEFQRKREIACEKNKATNREKEKARMLFCALNLDAN
uniref:Uncharacterized protein MANES_07G128200 n=1 Tax=Rhizophora mucronata TaxID=61149 RepID=A0A2P2J8R8_RHIMU